MRNGSKQGIRNLQKLSGKIRVTPLLYRRRYAREQVRGLSFLELPSMDTEFDRAQESLSAESLTTESHRNSLDRF